MRFQPPSRRISLAPVIAAAAGLVLAGCSSSGSPSSGASHGSHVSAAAAIKANWEAFFSASTPVARRVSLLQNGQVFQALIAAQAKSTLASSAAATVSKVSNVTSTQASVAYTITDGGAPALSGQHGVAVYQGGTWKVGDASFCGLLHLEKTIGLVHTLPAACSSAG